MSRTTIRMRVLPRFPARISGTNGIKSVRNGADLVVKNDFSDMIRIPGVDNQNKTFFLAWNADQDLYSILSFSDLFSAVPGVTGFMTTSVYDPSGRGVDIFAALDSKAWDKIGDYTLTAASLLSVTNLSAFRKLRLTGIISPSVQASLAIRTSTNNGTSYDAVATDYSDHNFYSFGSSGVIANGSTTQNTGYLTPAGIDPGGLGTFECIIENFNKPTACIGKSNVCMAFNGAVIVGTSGWFRNQTVARNALQIYPNAGTVSGTITVEGIRG